MQTQFIYMGDDLNDEARFTIDTGDMVIFDGQLIEVHSSRLPVYFFESQNFKEDPLSFDEKGYVQIRVQEVVYRIGEKTNFTEAVFSFSQDYTD